MKKKIWIYILLSISVILFLSLAVFIGNYRRHSESFSSLCISDEDFNSIINTHIVNKNSLLDEIYFDSNKLFYDAEDNHFYYSLVEKSKTANNPMVEWNSTRYSISIKNVEITDELIEKNEEIEVIIYDNKEYSLAKLSCTTLPLMNINVDVAHEEIENSYQDARMLLFDNENNTFTDLIGEVKTRGSNTLKYPKKSFKLKLKNKDDENKEVVSIMGFDYGREYILYPGYNDPERIRNVFSTNLWYSTCAEDNSFNIVNGQYYKYYEMFINNKYWGLYAITYPIDENVLNLDIDKESPNFLKENLYKKADTTNEREVNLDKFPIDGYDIKTNEDYLEAWQPLSNFYKTLFLEDSVENINNMIDLDNAIDIFLFYNLIQGVDNVSIRGNEKSYLHNTYLFSKVDGNNTRMLYTPWDMDKTWGYSTDDVAYGIDPSYNFVMYINPIFNLINLKDNNIKKIVNNKYLSLRNDKWSNENLVNILNELEKDVYDSGAYTRDIRRWPNSYSEDNSIKLTVFKEYVISRLGYMDMYIDNFVNGE